MQKHVRNRAVQIGRICGNNLLFAFNFAIKTHITYACHLRKIAISSKCNGNKLLIQMKTDAVTWDPQIAKRERQDKEPARFHEIR